MLRMSKLADYATVVMTLMAQAPDEARSAPGIAAAVDLELPTVSKILKKMVRTGLLLSQRGPKGGYRLARRPEAISVADIICAIEGMPLGLTECSSMSGLCSREARCAVRTNWQRISDEIRRSLERVTLAELAQEAPLPVAVPARISHRPQEQEQRMVQGELHESAK